MASVKLTGHTRELCTHTGRSIQQRVKREQTFVNAQIAEFISAKDHWLRGLKIFMLESAHAYLYGRFVSFFTPTLSGLHRPPAAPQERFWKLEITSPMLQRRQFTHRESAQALRQSSMEVKKKEKKTNRNGAWAGP